MSNTLDRTKLDALMNAINASSSDTGFHSQLGPEPAPINTNYQTTPQENEPSFFGRAMDVLARPMYAVENTIKDFIDPTPGTENPFESAWAGLSGIDKTTGSDVISKIGEVSGKDIPDWVKGVGGFAADLALDPTSYIPGGAILKAAKATKAGKAVTEAITGGEKLAEKIKAGEGLQERSAAEIKSMGGETPVTPKEEPVKLEESPLVQAKATVANQERAQNVADSVVSDTVNNPANSIPFLEDLSTPTPSNIGVKTKPLKLHEFDPATIDFVHTNFAENLKPTTGYTREEAAREAALSAAKDQKEADNLYRTAFQNDPVLGPDIHKEVAASQPVVTPKIDQVPIPEAVNVSDTGHIVNPKASEARQAQAYDQARLTQELTNRHWKVENPPGETFPQKMTRVYDNVSNDLRQSKEESIAAGNYPEVKLGDNTYNIHVSDVFDSVGKEGEKIHLSGYDKVPTSSILHGAAGAVEGKLGGLSGDALVNSVVDHMIKANKTTKPLSSTKATRAAKILVKHVDDIERRMVENQARFGKRDLVQGEAMGSKVAKEVKQTVEDPMAPTSAKIHQVADVNGKISREGKLVGVSPGGQAVGASRAAKDLAGTVDQTDIAAARTAEATAKDAAKGNTKKVKDRQKQQAKLDQKALDEDPNIRYVDIGERIDAALQKGIHRAYSVFGEFFQHGFRQGDSAALFRNKSSAAEGLMQDYATKLAEIDKKYPVEQQNAAYWALDSGIPPAPELEQAVKDMKPLYDHIWDMNSNSLVASIPTRSGVGIEALNAAVESTGLGPEFRFPTSIKGNKNPTVADVWHLRKDWKITGKDNKQLLDFMAKWQSAMLKISSRQAVGTDLVARFGRDTFAPGYVRVARMPYDRAPMSHFIDNESFIPREIAYELSNFNRSIDAATSFKGEKGAFAKLANNVIDPYNALLKPTQTIFRPGHHVKNNLGDLSMNIMSGMNRVVKHYRNAGEAMLAGGRLRKDFEGSQEVFSKTGVKGDGRTLLSFKLSDGSAVDLNGGQLYSAGARNGTIIGYKSAEDFVSAEGKGLVAKGTKALMNSGPAKFAGKVSEDSGNLHRMAQLSHLLSSKEYQGKFKTLDEAVHAANAEISKYHPDLGGLAAGESKYGRRVMLYYTWMRQAVPTILSASLQRPGRLTAVPKAYYNAQVSMGMNPESYQEPFDPEQMMPDFMRESVAGTFGTHTFNLGTPAETLASVFSHGTDSNPIKNAASYVGESLNPVFTAIPEFLKQQTLSGRHISDPSENLDQNIPFLNQISALSGYSATGTLGNIFGGASGPALDPQRATASGQKDFLFNQSMANLLSGLGIQDLENPSLRRLALRGGSQ